MLTWLLIEDKLLYESSRLFFLSLSLHLYTVALLIYSICLLVFDKYTILSVVYFTWFAILPILDMTQPTIPPLKREFFFVSLKTTITTLKIMTPPTYPLNTHFWPFFWFLCKPPSNSGGSRSNSFFTSLSKILTKDSIVLYRERTVFNVRDNHSQVWVLVCSFIYNHLISVGVCLHLIFHCWYFHTYTPLLILHAVNLCWIV